MEEQRNEGGLGSFVMERDGTSSRWSLCEVIVAEEGPVWIADVRFSGYETKQKEIAALIAASPDLLAALRSLLDWTDVGCDDPTCGKHREHHAVVDAGEAAISKATNHQPTESEDAP